MKGKAEWVKGPRHVREAEKREEEEARLREAEMKS